MEDEAMVTAADEVARLVVGEEDRREMRRDASLMLALRWPTWRAWHRKPPSRDSPS